MTVTCCPDPRRIAEYLPKVRPTWFFAVPRVWEKLKAGVEAKLGGNQERVPDGGERWGVGEVQPFEIFDFEARLQGGVDDVDASGGAFRTYNRTSEEAAGGAVGN